MKRRKVPLSTLIDVRRELAYLYRRVDAGQIGSGDAAKRAYLLAQVSDAIAKSEIEPRLREIEELAKAQGLL